jgi:plastocyanin
LRPRTLIGAGCAALALAPGLAFSQPQQGASFMAIDTPAPHWQSNGPSPTSVTIAPGQSVAFSYDGNQEWHFVDFEDSGPECTGVPTSYPPPPPKTWSGSCKFAAAGDYEFMCPLHLNMEGVVRVKAPAPTPTPTRTPAPTPTRTATPDPDDPNPAPAPDGGSPGSGSGSGGSGGPAAGQPRGALKLRLTAAQRGTRVRGAVEVGKPASRVEVTLTARLSGRNVRIGRWSRMAAATGTQAFSVRVDAKARRALRAGRRLAVRVAVALTPPGGEKVTRTRKVRLRGS